jgi:DNA-binding XRE family transcriptional regulator
MSMIAIDTLLAQLREAVAAEIASAGGSAVPADIGDLASLVRGARKKAGLTLEELAKLAGTSKSHIWETENGRAVRPSIHFLNDLARALGLPLSHLCAAALAPAKEPALG